MEIYHNQSFFLARISKRSTISRPHVVSFLLLTSDRNALRFPPNPSVVIGRIEWRQVCQCAPKMRVRSTRPKCLSGWRSVSTRNIPSGAGMQPIVYPSWNVKEKCRKSNISRTSQFNGKHQSFRTLFSTTITQFILLQ